MNIIIIAVGKNRNYISEDAVLEYSIRLQHYTPVEWVFISGSGTEEEGRLIVKAIPEQSYVVLLDEKGKSFTSPQLADFIQKRLNESVKRLVFIIGGAHGFDERVIKRAQFNWSLSALTFPHELIRAILAETLYRAYTIIQGEKYHHA